MVVIVVATVSPYLEARVRKQVSHFVEIDLTCPLDVLLTRDQKGLYRLASGGILNNFTGISDPNEPTLEPDLVLNISRLSADTFVTLALSKFTRMRLNPHDCLERRAVFILSPTRSGAKKIWRPPYSKC